MSSQKSKLNLSNKALTSVADRNSKQLQLCQKRSRGLTNENAFLRKKGREAKRQAQRFKQEGKKLIAIFKSKGKFIYNFDSIVIRKDFTKNYFKFGF